MFSWNYVSIIKYIKALWQYLCR